MVSSLEAQLEEINEKEVEILGKIDERNNRKKIECAVNSCGKLHTIKNLILIQTYWYVQPHGCTGGDYWNQGEIQFVCPETGTVNRIMIDNYDVPYEERDKLENNPEAQFKDSYKLLFKEIITDHSHRGEHSYEKNGEKLETEEVTNGDWVNNYYVDNNRKKFRLVEKRKREN